MAAPSLVLEVNGSPFEGWKRVAVELSMEALAGSFELAVSERFPTDPLGRPIREGDRAELKLHGELVIRGYVDDVARSYETDEENGQHTVTVSGRDATGDLVDCSVTHEPGEWTDRLLEEIAREVVAPFRIPLRIAEATASAFAKVKTEESETAYELIERLCRQRGLLPMSDRSGGLLLSRLGPELVPTPIVLGENVLRGELVSSIRDRHSLYRAKGQAKGSDDFFGRDAASPVGEATDPLVTRFRPLTLLADEPADADVLKRRATWESTVRAGRSRVARYTVQGWRHARGLWLPNTRVRVRDELLGLARELLIASVRFSFDEDRGSRTVLDLTLPEAFAPEPVKVPKGKATEIWHELDPVRR